jgi:hypothetical protein
LLLGLPLGLEQLLLLLLGGDHPPFHFLVRFGQRVQSGDGLRLGKLLRGRRLGPVSANGRLGVNPDDMGFEFLQAGDVRGCEGFVL